MYTLMILMNFGPMRHSAVDKMAETFAPLYTLPSLLVFACKVIWCPIDR